MSPTNLYVDVERYRLDGYLTAPAVVTPQESAELRAESDRLLGLCSSEPERYNDRIQWETDYVDPERRAMMDRVVRMVEPVVDIGSVFADLAHHPGIVDQVGAIFNEPVELFEDKLNLKLAGGSSYPWHQDWVCCWRAQTDELITCFVYLDDASRDNGCLEVMPGSHLGKPQLPFKAGSRFEIDPEHVPASRGVPVPLRAGDMIFFDPYLLHYSNVNRSTISRRAIIFTYNTARLGRINEGRFPVASADGRERRSRSVLL